MRRLLVFCSVDLRIRILIFTSFFVLILRWSEMGILNAILENKLLFVETFDQPYQLDLKRLGFDFLKVTESKR